MSPIAPVLAAQSAEIAALTGQLGRRVDVAALRITDREGDLSLASPGGRISPNGACRLVRAADGWIALNLARDDDRDLIPAWLGCDFGGDPWALVEANAPRQTCSALVAGATLLGLPAGAVGEVTPTGREPRSIRMAVGGAFARPLRVVDLSAMWAGPMCGAILAAMGAAVTKVESTRRPDPVQTSTPNFFRRLNGEKAHLALDLADPDGQARLREEILAADIVVTGARPRAFASLGLDPAGVFAANPGLVWVAVTGYGWTGEAATRVGFGDDTAAAGGLVGWAGGEPRFLGDALADPVTGLAAAIGALRAVAEDGGVLVDVALARSAAAAAEACGLRRAA